MRWLISLVLLLHLFTPSALAAAATAGAQSQSDTIITDLGVSFKFGAQINFRLQVQPVTGVRELLVYITPKGQPTVWQKISLSQANSKGEITQTVNARQLVLYPFTSVSYHYEATLANGSKVSSPVASFSYDDNRYKWQNLPSGIFQIFWNSDESTLGQQIADIAKRGLEQAQSILPAKAPTQLRIYAYSSARDLQSALQMTSQSWVAGQAAPQDGMILISVPSGPEKKLELERQIPHEIMHTLEYQVMGSGFRQQPAWLVEGLASLAEPYPNPEYARVLQAAASSNELIPFDSMCIMFPRDAAPAFQAYAQSESFVGYIKQKYGSSGLMKLVNQYKNGVGCSEGVANALGTPLTQLEHRWQQETLGVNVQELVFSNLAPFLLLGLLILLPAALAFIPFRRPADTGEENA